MNCESTLVPQGSLLLLNYLNEPPRWRKKQTLDGGGKEKREMPVRRNSGFEGITQDKKRRKETKDY